MKSVNCLMIESISSSSWLVRNPRDIRDFGTECSSQAEVITSIVKFLNPLVMVNEYRPKSYILECLQNEYKEYLCNCDLEELVDYLAYLKGNKFIDDGIDWIRKQILSIDPTGKQDDGFQESCGMNEIT